MSKKQHNELTDYTSLNSVFQKYLCNLTENEASPISLVSEMVVILSKTNRK